MRSFRGRRLVAILGLLSWLVAGCQREAPGTRDVTLLAFGDFHGALGEPHRDTATGRLQGGARALAAAIAAERGHGGRRTFLLEAGDAWQGTPESNFFFGRTTVTFLNRLGVDAAALGNHEFDWGVDTLRARLRESVFPRLAANVFAAPGGRPDWCSPWTVIERNGLRLGVIGFITPETPRVTLPQNVAHLRFPTPESQVDSLVAVVRAAGADVVVLLCHLGGRQDSTGTIAGPLADLAGRARGVDAVIGGHWHTAIAGHVGRTPVVATGEKGRHLGKIVLRWDGTQVVGSEATCVPVFADSLAQPVDDSIQSLLDSVRTLTEPRVAMELGRAPRRLGEEELALFIAEAMRRAPAADVGVSPRGGGRQALAPGLIRLGDLYRLVPFENSLVTARLTGEQLRRFLASSPQSARLRGLHVAADGSARIEAESTYVVVTNNFLATGGDGFEGFLNGSQVNWLDLLVRDVVQQAIVAGSPWGGELDLEGERLAPEPARP